MVDLTRRKTVIGLGLLATGSGATFTSAAFQSSTTPESDLRVVVEQNLQFAANPALDPGNRDDLTDNPGFFNDSGSSSGSLNESSGGAFDTGERSDDSTGRNDDFDEGNSDTDEDGDAVGDGFETGTPLAYVDGANEGLVVKTAVDIGTSTTFERLFQINNTTTSTIRVAIAYDRNNSSFDNSGTSGDLGKGQYGADIDVSGGSLSVPEAQRIYQFKVNGNASSDDVNILKPGRINRLISPDPGTTGIRGDSGDVTIENEKDLPAAAVEIPSGSEAILDLVVDTASDESAIRGAAELDPDTFGIQTDTVQIIDGITVLTVGNSITDLR